FMRTRTTIGSCGVLFCAGLVLFLPPLPMAAQGHGGGAAATRTPKEQALIDLTGYWVSIVTEDWRFRMVTPPKGDVASVPLNPAARAVADAWDPAKDTAAGNACKV